MRRLAAEATDELRAIVVGLRPADLAGDGLDVALRKQVELLDRVHAPAVRFAAPPRARLPAEAREEAGYRIAQEALHNALRHAGAGRGRRVALTAGGGRVVLRGRPTTARGFDPGRRRAGASGSPRCGSGPARSAAGSTVTSAPGRGHDRDGWRCPADG